MKLYYANESQRGMVAIIGIVGEVAHTVESNAGRATEEELQQLVVEIEGEFKPTETIRFSTIQELIDTYEQRVEA